MPTPARLSVCLLLFLVVQPSASAVHEGPAAQAPPIQASTSGADLAARIPELSSLDYNTRMTAARRIRRAPVTEAVAALSAAVRKNQDEYVRNRAFILLSAFNDRATNDVAREVLNDRNDRLRESAYKWLELHPDPAMAPRLLASLQTEQAEFVRPALVGALAALDMDPQVQRALLAESVRGLDFFRSAVIEALGRHRAVYAVPTLMDMAKTLDGGPLQDDVVLALGRIGDPRAVPVLQPMSTGRDDVALTARAAVCLLGADCDSQVKALAAAVTATARPSTIQAAASALSALAASGRPAALDAAVDIAVKVPAARDTMTLAVATVAVRRPDVMIARMEMMAPEQRAAAIDALREGFDALEEDFGEEQFFASVRAAYWQAGDGSAARTLMASLIDKLEF